MAQCRQLVFVGVLVIILHVLHCNGTTDTKLTREVHTQSLCNETNEVTLVHTRAKGTNDTLHYLFSTQGVPSILVVRTNNDAHININCSDFLSGNLTLMEKSINFTHSHYAYAIMFNRLIEYDDSQDYANVEKYELNDTEWRSHSLQDVSWVDLGESSDLHHNNVMFTLDDKHNSSLRVNENGSLSFSMTVMGKYVREEELPHLEYNANMTQLELLLDNVNTSFAASRFALEMTMVSIDGVPNVMTINSTSYIDDEHSPGVFEMIDWNAKGQSQDWSGFLQYKPVCYTSSSRTLNDATKAVYYKLVTPNATNYDPPPSLSYAYFGRGMYQGNFSMTMTNVSFGLSKDKFYRHTNYEVWAASIGFGKPPTDEISPLIIIILSVGLGLPIVLIALGSIGICVKKKIKKDSPYQEISSSSPDIN